MNRLGYAALVALATWGGYAALEIIIPPPGIQTASGQQGFPQGNIIGPGGTFGPTIENYFAGNVPVAIANVTGCVTGGSPSISGSMVSWRLTAGTTASTTCTITWPQAWKVAPICVLYNETALTGATAAPITVESTTVLTWTFVSTASTVWDGICIGRLN